MTLKATQGNMPVIFPFGHKILCDGYVIDAGGTCCNALKIKGFLCDGYVTGSLIST